MTLQESSIYIGLTNLRKKLYKAQLALEKTDRIVYNTPMMQSLRAAMRWYAKAFEVTSREKRAEYMSECIGEFATVRMDLDFMMEENMYKFKKHVRKAVKDVNGNALPVPPLTPSEQDDNIDFALKQKVAIYQIIATIETDIRKYKNSISRGKTLVG